MVLIWFIVRVSRLMERLLHGVTSKASEKFLKSTSADWRFTYAATSPNPTYGGRMENSGIPARHTSLVDALLKLSDEQIAEWARSSRAHLAREAPQPVARIVTGDG